ncbi:MAG: hypothetical protein MJZ20_13300 [Bacteroidaceae bacterium]|nr:hypothetical protein [Bacteroidaceae bacterium]
MKKLIFFATLLCLAACGGKKSDIPSGMTKEEYTSYKDILSSVNSVEQEFEGITTMTAEEAIQIVTLAEQLFYDYDPMGKDSATVAACQQLKDRVNTLRPNLLAKVEQLLPSIFVDVANDADHLLEKKEFYPVYLMRGDTLYVDIQTERAATLKIYNADAKSCLLTRSGKSCYTEKIGIKNTAIYLVEINPGQTQYASMNIRYTVGCIEHLKNLKTVQQEQVEGKAGDFLVESIKGIKMQNLFEEPRKFTLRGQLKAAFSGSYRGVVAIQVPSGASDILYSLRISTNEGDRHSDGKFHDNMETSYKRVKMLGLPVYESHNGSGLIATLLGENAPVREEDAYINLYVFYDAGQARKFQDGGDPAKIKYNIDYSKMGTQSCNDRIPTRGYKTVYLGFLNERVRYNNYVWLEAVSAVPTTEYFKPKFTLDE